VPHGIIKYRISISWNHGKRAANLNGGTWQVITFLARIAMKTDAHVQQAPIT